MRGEVFDIDVSDVIDFAADWKGPKARSIVQKGLQDAGQRSGKIVRDHGNKRAGKKRTGRLVSTVNIKTRTSTQNVTTDITWGAVSDKGFAYPKVVHDGRGPVFAKPGGPPLTFEIDGKLIHVRKVGPAKGLKFATRGLAAARPQIVAEHQKARNTIVQKLETM